MATNIIVARGGVEYIPPISLAFWRWLCVFIMYFHLARALYTSCGFDILAGKDFIYLRLTYLLNRKNTKHSQRNLYFQSAIAADNLNNNFYGIHGDWETRRFFSGFGYKKIINNFRNHAEQYYQLGIAPYIGEYGDFHTWIMLKSKKNSLIGNWKTYPVFKFFKGAYLQSAKKVVIEII